MASDAGWQCLECNFFQAIGAAAQQPAQPVAQSKAAMPRGPSSSMPRESERSWDHTPTRGTASTSPYRPMQSPSASAKGSTKGTTSVRQEFRHPPPPPPGPPTGPPIRHSTKSQSSVPQDEDLPSLEWYVLCDKLKPFEPDCVWERYVSDQEMILNNAYKAYTVRGEVDCTVKLYPTRKTTWLIDFKDESNMTQLHCTTNRQRAVVTNQPDPVDLHYEDVGPPRRAYVPAWDNPSRTDTAHDGPLCLHFCEQKVWCSETFKVKPCGKPCTLIHEHHGLHNCGQHTALVDLGEFAPGYGGGLYGEGRPQWNPDVPREVREFAHQIERSARDVGVRLESPQPRT